ncbi:MAG: NADP-dependent phosphogluconate dehydrogenase [Anaerolineae bacterium]|nr:NADP-dependent phosphogluconate dehydrogenase [Anaerolineae bacterium]
MAKQGTDTHADIGIIGLGVMGQMLALNMERNGFRVAGYDLDAGKVASFAAHTDRRVVGCESLEDFVTVLEKPRRIMMMVPAGKPVDAVIGSIKGLLDDNDLLVDGGNSHFTDTERRAEALAEMGIHYIGTGVSGGEYGALWGPSIMPGGQRAAWERMQPVLEAIAAKVDGEPCVTYMGPRGAGHYVKMVHNGIEYGDMQLIAEAYDVLHRGLGLSAAKLHEVFAEWNAGDLSSYLVEITSDILAEVDEETGKPLVDLILDEAKQKGTGKWTSQDALDLGAPTPTINAAVEARIVSAYKDERVAASKVLSGPTPVFDGDEAMFIDTMGDALYAAKVCSYAQGFALLRVASVEYAYDLDYGSIAKIWRGGCIIRAALLEDIRVAFARNPDLTNLLMDETFANAMMARQDALRKVVAYAVANGIPVPALSSALAYFDAYRSARLPANLTQAQRDYFGAHTYRRLDKEGSFHTEWVDMETPPEA